MPVISMAKQSCMKLLANGMLIAQNSLVSLALFDFPLSKNLVEVGGDIHLADFYGRTPLHVAAASDHHDMVAFLIANGANVNAVTVHDAKHLATMDAKVKNPSYDISIIICIIILVARSKSNTITFRSSGRRKKIMCCFTREWCKY